MTEHPTGTRAAELHYSKPVDEFPSFLSAVSMVTDERSTVVKGLIQAERKSPATYEPARQLFLRVLAGELKFEQASSFARGLPDITERSCAVGVLSAAENFLRSEPAAKVGRLPKMEIALPNQMKLSVAPVWLRHATPERLMLLHVWRTPLSPRQIQAAAAILKRALIEEQPAYVTAEMDFILVSQPEHATSRRFQRLSWESVRPLDDPKLDAFLRLLCDGFADYRSRAPRVVKKRNQGWLF